MEEYGMLKAYSTFPLFVEDKNRLILKKYNPCTNVLQLSRATSGESYDQK